ncbi:MAG TPA: anthranilate synthase component I [Streptosporangiaceae bacterium]|nr:anthranilate synthase component I [Streptosporangiaceae bacterium]
MPAAHADPAGLQAGVDYGADFGTAPPLGLTEFVTAGGVGVTRTVTPFEPDLLAEVTRQVDQRRGGIFSSGMEYPGRYSRWHHGYVDPCIELTARGRRVTATALNDRGAVLLPVIAAALRRAGDLAPGQPGQDETPAAKAGPRTPAAGGGTPDQAGRLSTTVLIPEPAGTVPEEERSRRPTVFSAIREIIALFAGPDDHLGLFGAFGYDLAFQFEPVRLRRDRDDQQRDLVLHLPDQLYVIDRKRETALLYSYDFTVAGRSTAGLDRGTGPGTPGEGGQASAARFVKEKDLPADPEAGAYARVVELARERFAAGDLFEVVPSHEFWAGCGSPAAFYERLRRRNPAPYEFFLNLGAGEYLVGASPEMYVRVTGDRVETCPIAGTVPRGAGPLQDAENIRGLLSSAKEESELTMCTDVDRNDKSRICVPGSVKVIGRRQIEMYSRVIHTVDHVEGRLGPEFDALDAFLTHMWAVTVTGAPKTWAMQFIEDHETHPRRWYGGAVGVLGFDGSMNTGLTLRTAHIRDGLACVRTGATLLFDSEPAAEEAETRLKARALLEVLAESARDQLQDRGNLQEERNSPAGSPSAALVPAQVRPPGARMRVLLVDHQDSFVHTLAGYFREHGARVTTLRAGFDPAELDAYAPDLVVLSPGPGRPADFKCSQLLDELDARGLAAFGVCLGLQAMVEHAGGTLSLGPPAHGKPGRVRVTGGDLLAGLPAEFTAGRYHSLHAAPDQVLAGFAVTATTPDGLVMAIENAAARRWAVQFHPESILTASGGAGHQVIANVLRLSSGERRPPAGGADR